MQGDNQDYVTQALSSPVILFSFKDDFYYRQEKLWSNYFFIPEVKQDEADCDTKYMKVHEFSTGRWRCHLFGPFYIIIFYYYYYWYYNDDLPFIVCAAASSTWVHVCLTSQELWYIWLVNIFKNPGIRSSSTSRSRTISIIRPFLTVTVVNCKSLVIIWK